MSPICDKCKAVDCPKRSEHVTKCTEFIEFIFDLNPNPLSGDKTVVGYNVRNRDRDVLASLDKIVGLLENISSSLEVIVRCSNPRGKI